MSMVLVGTGCFFFGTAVGVFITALCAINDRG